MPSMDNSDVGTCGIYDIKLHLTVIPSNLPRENTMYEHLLHLYYGNSDYFGALVIYII